MIRQGLPCLLGLVSIERFYLKLEQHSFTGYGEFQTDPSSEQLEAYFTLEPQDLKLLAKCRYKYTKLGMALQLCTLRFLGTFLENPIDVPQSVVQFLEPQLNYQNVRLGRSLGEDAAWQADDCLYVRPA